MKDLTEYNRRAWNNEVSKGNKWSIPVTNNVIENAKNGNWKVVLTPLKPVPLNWFPPTPSIVLCLASGGGQQGPVLAAAGYDVTIFDNAEKQLEHDKIVANQNDLDLKTVQGDMVNLSAFDDESFDLVFNPCSLVFTSNPLKVFSEVQRVLKKGGVFLTGFANPLNWLFDYRKSLNNEFVLKYSQPYTDASSLEKDVLDDFIEKEEPLICAHSLEILIGGQLKAGLVLTDLIEDYADEDDGLRNYYPGFIATRAIKV